MKTSIVLCLLLFLVPASAYAGEQYPSLMADREYYSVGDTVRLRIDLEGKGYRLGDIDAARIAPFEMAGKEEIYNEEKDTTSFIIKGAFYEVGEFTIPPFIIVDAEGNKINSASGIISVKPVRDKGDDELRPLKAQMSIDERGPVWPWAVLVLIVIAVLLLAYYLYRKKKALAPPSPPPCPSKITL